jgi:Deoxyribose-phosphate aldolase
MFMTKSEFAARINYSCIRPTFTAADVDKHSDIVVEKGFGVFCVPPGHVERVKKRHGDKIVLSTSVDYPFGRHTTKTKVAIARENVDNGANQMDIVPNYSMFLSGDIEYCTRELTEMVQAVKEKDPKVIVKVLAELSFYTVEQKKACCKMIMDCGADAIKTNGGYGNFSFRLSDVDIIKDVMGQDVWIKAAGDANDAGTMLAAFKAGCREYGNYAEACQNAYDTFDDYIKYY